VGAAGNVPAVSHPEKAGVLTNLSATSPARSCSTVGLERSFPSMLPTDGTADPATYCRRGSGARGRGHEWLRGREREAILRPPRLRVPYDPRFAAPLARLLMARCVRLARLAEPPSQDTWGTTGRHRRSQVVRGWNSRTTQTRGRSTPSIASGPAACFKGIAATQVAGGRALEGLGHFWPRSLTR
jgi:hypothetical protein